MAPAGYELPVSSDPRRDEAASPARLVLGAGARATEDALLVEVARRLDAAGREPERLARPWRLVVPSRPLRAHMAARLVAATGRPRLGVVVQTLHGLTLEVLARAGLPLRDGHLLFPVLVRRLARAEPALHGALDAVQEGYAVATQTVADLLDAGALPAHAEGIEERLAAEVGAAEAARGAALVRVALAASRELAAAGLVHRSALFREARERLRQAPATLPTAGVLVHGYADVTGVQADLLETLLDTFGGAAFVDTPPDPADPARSAPGSSFLDRLRGRLEARVADVVRAPGGPPPRLDAFAAPGAQVEAREVAERVAELLDAGSRPERVGVVARDLDEYADALETHLRRLGVPFTAGEGVPSRLGPDGRAPQALLDLLAHGGESSADRWLDAVGGLGALRKRDLRLALHALGASRLRHVAVLPLDEVAAVEGGMPLPVRRGLRDVGDDEGEAVSSGRIAPRRHLARAVLEDARARAATLIEGLETWPDRAGLAVHAERLRALLERALGWDASAPAGAAAWRDRLARLVEELGPDTVVDRDELWLLLERRMRDLGRRTRGSAEGGVRVLTVMEARGLTFEHLFVLGLNRDRFPRPTTQDPLLRDAARRRLEALLPDVPVKSRAFHEDRYLFAALCAAAPRVTLSWQAVSDDGRERPPSPLVERLRIEGRLEEPRTVPGLFDARRDRPRPAFEHAVMAGLAGRRGRAARALEAALRPIAEGPDAREVARALGRAGAELESREAGLGPFLGRVGANAVLSGPPFVTWLEALARCPWRAFLERVLRLESLPDARSELPGLQPTLIGDVVHGVLERIARGAGVPATCDLDPGAAEHDVPWPPPDVVETLLAEEAARAARERGASFPGFARAVVARARPYLETLRRVEWHAGLRRGVLGAEVDGVAVVEGPAGARRVRFRADRADRDGEWLRLLDYKTGRPPSSSRRPTPESMREAWRAEVERGLWLQGVAYAHADGATRVRGGYAFGHPDLDEGTPRTLEAGRDDAALADAFVRSTGVLFEAAERGMLPPRLVGEDGTTPRDCTEYCAVRDACLQHDTTARWRVRRLRLDGASDSDADLALARRVLAMGPRS